MRADGDEHECEGESYPAEARHGGLVGMMKLALVGGI
jgi:hypothetical protein